MGIWDQLYVKSDKDQSLIAWLVHAEQQNGVYLYITHQ